jgi:hypothetical protein
MKVSELLFWLDRLPGHADVLIRNAEGEWKPIDKVTRLTTPGTIGTSNVILELLPAEAKQNESAA